MVTLFVVGFSLEMNECDLARLFSRYGGISWGKIVVDKNTGKSLGYAFVGIRDQDTADRVITGLNRKLLNLNRITVKIAKNHTQVIKKCQDDDKLHKQCQQVQSQVELIKRRRPRINPNEKTMNEVLTA